MVVEANDKEVIEACQRGDHDAFRALFEAHKNRVYSIALRYSGDHATALDIAQETFLKLLSRIQQYRGDSSFDSWLCRLVVNTCLDHHRRRRRLLPLMEDLLNTFRSPNESVLHQLLRSEEQQRVQEVVAQLPPDQRMVVVLRYTDGLPYEDIAIVLGCSRGTVASRLNRAHKTLERRLSHLSKSASRKVGKVVSNE